MTARARHRRRRVGWALSRIAFGAFATALGAACSLFTDFGSLHEDSSNADATGDVNAAADTAATSDASTPTDGSVADRIEEDAPPSGPPSKYRDAVIADTPVGYWRLGEKSGSVAKDEIGKKDRS